MAEASKRLFKLKIWQIAALGTALVVVPAAVVALLQEPKKEPFRKELFAGAHRAATKVQSCSRSDLKQLSSVMRDLSAERSLIEGEPRTEPERNVFSVLDVYVAHCKASLILRKVRTIEENDATHDATPEQRRRTSERFGGTKVGEKMAQLFSQVEERNGMLKKGFLKISCDDPDLGPILESVATDLSIPVTKQEWFEYIPLSYITLIEESAASEFALFSDLIDNDGVLARGLILPKRRVGS